jgi:hypothetical protein
VSFEWPRIQPTDFPANTLGAPVEIYIDERLVVIEQEEQYAVHMVFVEPEKLDAVIQGLEAARAYLSNLPKEVAS